MANEKRGSSFQRREDTIRCRIRQFKLVLLGESAVGKSSLALRFVKEQFHEYHAATVGIAMLTRTVIIGDTAVDFKIWVSLWCLMIVKLTDARMMVVKRTPRDKSDTIA